MARCLLFVSVALLAPLALGACGDGDEEGSVDTAGSGDGGTLFVQSARSAAWRSRATG